MSCINITKLTQVCIEPVRTKGEGVRRSGTADTSADTDVWAPSRCTLLLTRLLD